jgi:hypothetical protein
MRFATKGASVQALKRAFTPQTLSIVANYSQTTFLRFAETPRFNSTVSVDGGLDVPIKEVGKVERTLKALDMAIVRQIKAELMEVDANSDGRQVHK